MMYSAKGIDSSDAFPAAELSEAELDGVAGGMIKQPGPERPPGTNAGGAGGETIDARWSQHPIYLGPF